MKKNAFFGLLVIFLVFSLISCDDDNEKSYFIKYEISGPSLITSSVVYYKENQLYQLFDEVIPWEHTYTITLKKNYYEHLYCGLHFLKNTPNSSQYTIRIFVDNKLVITDFIIYNSSIGGFNVDYELWNR